MIQDTTLYPKVSEEVRDTSMVKGGWLNLNVMLRKTWVQHVVKIDPGPGSYRSGSDFGHYDGNVYN